MLKRNQQLSGWSMVWLFSLTAHAAAVRPAFFNSSHTYPAGNGPVSLAVGDFNGDGRPDLVAVDYYSNEIAILIGKGDGGFKPPRFFSDAPGALFVAVGDFNGDGRLDLAVTYGQAVSGGPGSLSIYLGNGDGTFQPPMTYSVGGTPLTVTMSDLTGDNKLDLVVPNYANPGNIDVLLGNGDGTFQPAVSYDAGSFPGWVAAADLNGDGIPDLAVTNNAIGPPGTVSILSWICCCTPSHTSSKGSSRVRQVRSCFRSLGKPSTPRYRRAVAGSMPALDAAIS